MDDASRSSSMSKARTGAEESGWTAYFDDFFASQKRDETAAASGDCSSAATAGSGDHCGSSMISDAASCAAWKVRGAAEDRKKLSFRKRKPGPVVEDDSLEDTASSPVNSPKVLQEKGAGSDNFRELKGDATDELGSTDDECIDLKKKGLCLVPNVTACRLSCINLSK